MNSVHEFIKQFKGNRDYLGDGAYVGYTGYSYVIFTSDGINVLNEVHLENNEINALNRFIESMRDKHER